MDKHEEGTLTVEVTLDSDWCVRKASIVKSSGYWRLDRVSLSYMITVKYQPKPESIKIKNGEPTTVVKIGWCGSQGKQ